MKITKIIGIALSLILVFALAISITACKEDNKKDDPTPTPTPTEKDITGISFTDGVFTYDGTEKKLEITGTLPEGVTATYSSNTATDAGEYTATVTLTGEGYKTKTLTAKLTVNKADITGVSASDLTVTYDGTEKKIELVGTLPEGVSAKAEGNTATDAGEYTATFTLTGKNYNNKVITVALIINKADLTGITLPSKTFIEDGTEKSLEIEGTLPEGVAVTYTGNGVSTVGNHPVSATITGKNYNTLELNSFIVIEAAVIPEDKDITGVNIYNAEFTYDGTAKSIEIEGELPEGVTVEYAGNGKINHGTYTVSAVLSGEGYKTTTLTATLTIKKATITGITFADGKYTYQESIYHSIKISGELPEGVTVTYTGNGVTNVGTYTVTATISGDNYETLVLTATLVVEARNGSGVLTPIHPFT